ncbi:ATP-binding protein [Bifidobacterium sp. ESL0798]|uniref:ATP-binding protein n=1 Tax=Bifidobacterium sp. ESL0798 TaxID=2983235 RepID=UPI0032AF5202
MGRHRTHSRPFTTNRHHHGLDGNWTSTAGSATGGLEFNVTRESITNAIRHGQGVNRIVVSWDHDAQGGIAITVRDNGKPVDESGQDGGDSSTSDTENGRNEAKPGKYGDGTGLVRLKESVERIGGTFAAGPDSDGWTVKAYIPSLSEPLSKQLQGSEQS